MCGRFNLVGPGNLHFRFATQNELPELPPRYNIAPGQEVLIVTNQREMELVRWGLIPYWAKDAKFGNRTINARAYRTPFRLRRCLIPATGFDEWKQTPEGKVPYHIRLKSGAVCGFAGLYDVWRDEQGEELGSCTIITTTANDVVRPIHDRMPVIIPRDDEAYWLDPEETDPERLIALLKPYSAEEMEAYPVSELVNRVGNESAALLEPVLVMREEPEPDPAAVDR